MAYKISNGSWRVEYFLNGKRRTKQFPTRALAKAFEAKVRLKRFVEPEKRVNLTFQQFAQQWMEKYCRLRKAESQWIEDESMLRNHLNPAFGKIKLEKLDPSHLEQVQQKLSGRLKPKSINNITNLAKTMLGQAVKWRYLLVNPFLLVDSLRVGEQDFDFWTIEERESFLSHCYRLDAGFAEIVEFATHTGLRVGEIHGLRRDCLDFSRRTIVVKRNYVDKTKKHYEFNKTKTIGQLPMNQRTFEILSARENLPPEELVFKASSAICDYSEKLKRLAKKSGVKQIRFHDLRHTYASCLVMAGVDIFVVKELMRHANIKMTLRYSHLDPDYLSGKTDCLVVPTFFPQSGLRLVPTP